MNPPPPERTLCHYCKGLSLESTAAARVSVGLAQSRYSRTPNLAGTSSGGSQARGDVRGEPVHWQRRRREAASSRARLVGDWGAQM